LAELGLRPLVRLVSWAVAGVPPATMGIGPGPATAAALHRAGLELADMDLIEVDEAFAAQALAVAREWRLTEPNRERVNVNGSGISPGHPRRRHRRPHPHRARPGDTPPQCPLLPGTHVHRRRSRTGCRFERVDQR
jgi:hypothetical protein